MTKGIIYYYLSWPYELSWEVLAWGSFDYSWKELELESSPAPPGCISTVASLCLASQLEWLEQ